MHAQPLSLAGLPERKAVMWQSQSYHWHRRNALAQYMPNFYHRGEAVTSCMWVLTVNVLLYQNAYSCLSSHSSCNLVAYLKIISIHPGA